MNDQDRKLLEEIKGKLEPIQEELGALTEDLEDRTFRFEEYFEGSEKAELMNEQTERVRDLNDNLETLISDFEEAMS